MYRHNCIITLMQYGIMLIHNGVNSGYQLLAEAKDMPKEFQYLRVRLKTEQHRLLDWARVANLSEQDASLSTNFRLHRHLLLEVLDQTEALLLSFGKFNDRYRQLVTDSSTTNADINGSEVFPEYSSEHPSSPPSLQKFGTLSAFQDRFPHSKDTVKQKCLDWIEKSRKYPKRLRWATFDHESFEKLLAKLASLNDFLKGLMDSSQQVRLAEEQQQTNMQILQLNNKVDDLLQIVRAVTIPLTLGGGSLSGALGQLQAPMRFPELLDTPRADEASPPDLTLASLARFKALSTAIDTDVPNTDIFNNFDISRTHSEISDPKLDARLISAVESSGHYPYAGRCEARYQGENVWIEWKDYEPIGSSDQPAPYIQKRVAKLAALLHDNKKPEEFRAPECLGYFDDPEEDHYRFGFVFQKPPGSAPETPPVSLLRLLEKDQPSLTDRVNLASAIAHSIHYLHSTNWLHKGLRSHNIIFFPNPSATVDFSKPYLCGFDYARPAASDEVTERPPENPEYDVYRHQLAQGDAPREGTGGFRKTFDIYSLGVILVEIALWQPIPTVLGIEPMDKYTGPNVTKNVQARLLNEKQHLDRVRSAVGDVFAEATRACLRGEFGIDVRNEANDWVSWQLQVAFNTMVVRRLSGIVL